MWRDLRRCAVAPLRRVVADVRAEPFKQSLDDRLVDEPEVQILDDVRAGHVGRRRREGACAAALSFSPTRATSSYACLDRVGHGAPSSSISPSASARSQVFYHGFTPAILRAFPTVSQTRALFSRSHRTPLTVFGPLQNASALLVWESVMRFMGAEKV
jgi:hypothetical protein